MHKDERVVISGMGVVAPNAVGVVNFEKALRAGHSGITFIPELAELNFRCQIGGVPPTSEEILRANFNELELKRLSARGLMYGVIAAREAWQDAGLDMPAGDEEPLWDTGCIFGTGLSGVHTLREAIYKTDEGRVRKLGTAVVEQTMPSGISAFLSGIFGLGNWVSSNSSACSTGTESIIMAYEHIRRGRARIMICGGCDSEGPHVWGGFDSMRVLSYRHNDNPQAGSRPMSGSASGFVPGSGGAALILESLSSARARGARIYAEVKGGYLNSGGQRGQGSMTAPHGEGVRRCIRGALQNAGVKPEEIDLVSGHLTSTMGDVLEVENWAAALGRRGDAFPYINSTKSMTGHCLSAAGAVEAVAAVLQLYSGFMHPSLNCEDLHPEIAKILHNDCVVREKVEQPLRMVAKSSFGFGDVNSCVIFKNISNE